MKKRFAIIIFSFPLFFFACSTAEEQKHSTNDKMGMNRDYIEINIDKIEKESIKLDDLIESIAIVELMNNDSCYIIDIDRIEEHKNEYFVFDKQQSSLFVFNKEGVFLRKIGERGIGPEMYRDISSFSLDKNRDIIIIHSNNDMALIEYRLNGTFNKRIKLEFFAQQMILINPKTLAFYTGYNFLEKYNVILTDLLGQEKSQHIPLPDAIMENGYINIGGLSKSKERCLFNEIASSFIYEFSDSILKPAYQIDLGKHSWPEENKADLKSFNMKFMSHELSYLFNNFIESSNVLLFQYLENRRLNKAIYSKSENKLYTAKNLEDDGLQRLFLYTSMPVGFDMDGKFLSCLKISKVFSFREKYAELYDELKEQHPHIYQSMENATENSNPILLIYDFK